jgi:hypothetical protein
MGSECQIHSTRAAEISVSSLVAVALLATWLTIFLLWPVPFWHAGNDYVDLSLAHAIYLEASLHGQDGGDPALANHPGLPFYLASWLALRAAALGSGAQDIVKSTFDHPDRFFLFTRIIAGLVTASGVAGAWLLLRRLDPVWRLLAILSFFAAAAVSYRYSLVILGNETFALPLAALLFWAIDRCARNAASANWPWLILGAVAALGYTVKLLYLDLLVAACAVALMDSWWNAPGSRVRLVIEFTRRIACVLISFFAIAGSILLAVLGRETLKDLLRFHAGIFTHSGAYGSGDIGFVSATAVHEALLEWFNKTALPYLIPLAIGGAAVVLWTQLKGPSRDRQTALWATASLAAIVSASAAILKHYQLYYVVALCALLPFAFAPVLQLARTKWIVAAAILAGFGLSTSSAMLEFSNDSKEVATITEDLARIRAMPLKPGEARLWSYRSPTEQFSAAFIASYAGAKPIMTELADPNRQDFSCYSMVQRPYRYVVLDRKTVPDAEAVRNIKGSLDRVQAVFVPLAPEDKIHELQRFIVVEKAAP